MEETKPNDFLMDEQDKYENIFSCRMTGLFVESYLHLCQKDNTFKPKKIQEVLNNVGKGDNGKLSVLDVKYTMGNTVKILRNDEVELTIEAMELLKKHFIKK